MSSPLTNSPSATLNAATSPAPTTPTTPRSRGLPSANPMTDLIESEKDYVETLRIIIQVCDFEQAPGQENACPRFFVVLLPFITYRWKSPLPFYYEPANCASLELIQPRTT